MVKTKRAADDDGDGRPAKVAKRDRGELLPGFNLPGNTPVGGCLAGWEPPRTGLEQQFMQYKVHLADTLIAVECGYKYRFFGRDAEIAGELLGFFVNRSGTDTYKSCSFPVNRLQVNTTRLANNGYRVAHLAQAETAALKADAGKGGLFARVITGLFTRTTQTLQVEREDGGGGDVSSNNFVIISERPLDRGEKGATTDQVECTVLSISLATGGVVVWDVFRDGPLRRELMTRLLHFEPVEIIAPDDLTLATTRCLESLGLNRGVTTKAPDHAPGLIRFETLPGKEFHKDDPRVDAFFAPYEVLSEEVGRLPPSVRLVLGVLVRQLFLYRQQQFLLTRGTSATGGATFHRFSGGGYMKLPSETLTNLEVFTASGSNRSGAGNSIVHGSLNWVVNRCRTGFGTRRVRLWLSKPLVDVDAIRARHAAVADMAEGPHKGELLALRNKVLSGTPDLERIVTKMSYGKAQPREMLTLLTTVRRLVQGLRALDDLAACRENLCPLLQRLVSDVHWDALEELCAASLARFNTAAAQVNNKEELFLIADQSLMPEEIRALNADAEEQIDELGRHLVEVRKILDLPSLEYKSVATTEYLIDVPNARVKRVPKSWKKINEVKASKRYHSPEALACIHSLQVAKDRMKQAADVALGKLQEEFTRNHIQRVQHFLDGLADLDALFSFAGLVEEGGWCRPEMLDAAAPQTLEVTAGRHPVIDQLLRETDKSYIPNDVRVRTAEHEQIIVVTGPNMGGKSSYLRQAAVAVLLAQAGCFVPGAAARLSVFDGIYVRLGSQDSIMDGQSSFLVEISETAAILKRATARSLLVLDELGRGTSTFDGIAIAHAVMDWLVNRLHCTTLFVTHYPELLDLAPVFTNKIRTCHMSFSQEHAPGETEGAAAAAPEDPADDHSLNVKFLYKLVSGTSPSSFGMNVARLAGLPNSVLQTAVQRSQFLKSQSDAYKRNAERSVQSVFALLALHEELAKFIAGGGDAVAVELFKSAISYIDTARIVAGGAA